MIIKTTKLPATDTEGERILARITAQGDTMETAWDYGMDEVANHAYAAFRLVHFPLEVSGEWDRGYYFTTE